MANGIAFNGSGHIDGWSISFADDFSVTLPKIVLETPHTDASIILGNDLGTNTFIAVVFEGTLRIRINGATGNIGGYPAGTVIEGATLTREAGASIAVFTHNEVSTNITASGTVVFSTWGAYNTTPSLFNKGTIEGLATFSGSGVSTITHDFNGTIGSGILENTTSGDGTNDGVLNGGLDYSVFTAEPAAPTATVTTADQTGIAANTTVSATGTATPVDPATIVSTVWTQTSGAETVTLTGATTLTVGFDTPATAQTTILTLTVTDSDGLTDADTWSVQNDAAVVAPDLEITAPTANQRYKQRNGSNQYTFAVSGTTSDLPGGAIVQYRLDGGAWLTLDAAPTATFSGSVTVTSTQEIECRILDGATPYGSSIITCGAVFVILGDGQSNMDGRGTNLQTVSLDVGAKTPLMLRGTTISAAADATGTRPSSAGTWHMRFLSLLANANPSITYLFVNMGIGGTSMNTWLKSNNTNYNNITTAYNFMGGAESSLTLIGETDADNDMPEADVITKYGSFIDDKKTDFGVDTYLINFPALTYSGDADLRSGFASLVANNASCFDGGDLRVLDIANTGGDGIHIQTDSQLNQAGDVIYAAFTDSPEATITVAATLGTITYASQSTSVSITGGNIDINATLGTISYTRNNAVVTIGAGALIGSVTVTFAPDLSSVTFNQ